MTDAPSTPPGWHDDGSGRQRWWDGQQWGAFADQPAASPVGPEAPKGEEAPKASEKDPWYKNKFVWLVVALVVLGTFIGINAANENAQSAPTPSPTATAQSVDVPDVQGMDGAAARDALTAAGFEVEFDAGDDSVWRPANWTVDSQEPAPGTKATPGDTVTLTVSKPVVEPSQPSNALDEVNAAQFLALAWEDRFIYGGTVHWIVDRITTTNADGTFTFKIGATVKNEYGTELAATIEGDVGGTNSSPVILDSIMYSDTGEIVNY